MIFPRLFLSLTLALWGGVFVSAVAVAQQDYASFKTDDESNNIEVFKQASPSVVYITNSRLVRRSFYSLNPQEIPQGSGSGFIWSRDGYVGTNFHVIQQASRLTVTLQDGSAYDAEVVGVEPDKDVAVLRIDACYCPLMCIDVNWRASLCIVVRCVP